MDLDSRAGEHPQPVTLTEAIQHAADCPCDQHRGALLAALAATDELVFLVVSHNMSLASGLSLADGVRLHIVGAGDQVNLQRADVQGHAFLLAFPDINAARRDNPNGAYAGVGRNEAIAMVIGDPTIEGILLCRRHP